MAELHNLHTSNSIESDRFQQKNDTPTTSRNPSGGRDNNAVDGGGPNVRCFTLSEQGKRVRFYRNGDQFFKGLWYTISSLRSWEALLQNLNQHLSDSITLPQGVRFIFTVNGRLVKSLEELEHGSSYVTSSTEKFKMIDYANAAQPIWSFVSSKLSESPFYGSVRPNFQREPNDFVRPRIITIIRNGLKPRRIVRHLLNKRTALSFEHVMQDISSIVNLNSGVVRKLYSITGKQVTCLADFFGRDHVFVAYGQMDKISTDDFYVVSEEYRGMNVGRVTARRLRLAPKDRKMPMRNDAFRKTLSPDPKSMQKDSLLPELLRDKITIMELLGDGNTALVFKAAIREPWQGHANLPSNKSSEVRYDALKIIRKENADEMLEFIRAEIDLMSRINHEHIIKLHDYQVVDNSWFIRMELMEGGDLFEYLRRERTLNEPNAASCVSCLCKALQYLHNQQIVHRDVKPENLLIYTCPQTNLLLLKLADFGLATHCPDNEPLYQLCGTPTYVAPEVLSQFGYSFKADCWSAGVILYILHCGFPPFGVEDDEALFDKIIRGQFDFPSPSFDNVSNVAKLLIRQMINTDQNNRLSSAQVLESIWVRIPGFTNKELEDNSAVLLSDLMADLYDQDEFEESDTEFFYSRRASMDEFSDRSGSIQPNSSIDDSHNNASLHQIESECKNVIASAGTEGNILIFPPSVMKQEIGQQEDNSQMEVSEVAEISHQLNQSSFVSTEISNSHMPPPPMTPKSSRSQMRNKMLIPSGLNEFIGNNSIPNSLNTNRVPASPTHNSSKSVAPVFNSMTQSTPSPRSGNDRLPPHPTPASTKVGTPRRPKQRVITPRVQSSQASASPLRVRMK